MEPFLNEFQMAMLNPDDDCEDFELTEDNEESTEVGRSGLETGYIAPDFVTCPFCGEKDFDLVGLKGHLMIFGCEEFEKINEHIEA